MKDSVFKALEIVAEHGTILITDLKSQYMRKYGDFDPRIIGSLCGGATPNCQLRGSKLEITTRGKKNIKTIVPESDDGPDESEDKTTTSKPTPPRARPKTIKTGFVETNGEVGYLLYSVDKNKNTLLCGPTGCGKSFLIEEVSKAQKKKLWTVNCDVELDKTELVGHYEVVSDGEGNTETRWVKGILVLAMENGDWIVFDEVNMARPEVFSVLHQALDHRRTLTVKEHGNEEVKAHEDFRVFASMNPNYAGTAELNQAFRRRFEVILKLSYLPKSLERKLIIDRTGIDFGEAEKCVNMANDTRELAKEGKINYPVSTAHLIEFAHMMTLKTFTPLECAKATLNVTDDPDEIQDILNCVKSYWTA